VVELEQQMPQERISTRMRDIQLSLQRLERRDWWMWWAAIIVMLLLTLGVISFSVHEFAVHAEDFFSFNLSQAIRGLVGMVLLFNVYTIYQQIVIKRLRSQIANQVGEMAQLEVQAEELYQMAVLDPLTGLHNRRFAEQRIVAEISRAQRQGQPLTVLMVDLDDFKDINDQHGHLAGDRVLQFFAERLKHAVRFADLPVRIGGDEFLVLLPDCRTDQIERMLARIRSLHLDFDGRKIHITFSAGWVGYQDGETPETLLHRADEALYADKRARKEGNHRTAQVAHPS